MTVVKTVSILGSTGSIGQTSSKIIKLFPAEYKVKALIANSNVKLLAKQALELDAEIAVINDQSLYTELRELLSGSETKVYCGSDAVVQAASEKADVIISAITGFSGLLPTLSAIKQGTTVALANKESLVCGGKLIQTLVKQHNTNLIPIDSEHNAIYQMLRNNNEKSVQSLTITASGGPFLNFEPNMMKDITPQQATSHPTWSMGKKISVDSATLMNKALELIEASYLFPEFRDHIEVIIHPQSIIHAIIAYVDHTNMACMNIPDMAIPISYALKWPDRHTLPESMKLDLAKIGTLSFLEADEKKYPAISIAKTVLNKGHEYIVVMNAANEVAVDLFLQQKIRFIDILDIVGEVIGKHQKSFCIDSITGIQELDKVIRYMTKDQAKIRLAKV